MAPSELEDGKHTSKLATPRVLEDPIAAKVSYLIKDPKHEHEKPYTLNYDAQDVIPRTNTSNESKPVVIHNFRPLQNIRSFENYGFTSAKINCPLSRAELNDEKKVKEAYYTAVKKVLWQMFPDAKDIQVLEHGLRKRHELFPIATESAFGFQQPATLVHTDFTPDSASLIARAAFSTSARHYRRLVTVNLWQPLQGFGNDWPLALCDWRTIDRSSESIKADVVFHNRFTENERLYYSPRHEWYYFKDLAADEAVVFRQTDSSIEGGGGVAHTSFFNSRVDAKAAPRESIELRAFIFYE